MGNAEFARLRRTACRCAVLVGGTLVAAGLAAAQVPSDQAQANCQALAADLQRESTMQANATRVEVQSHADVASGRCYVLESSSVLERSPALDRVLTREKKRLWDAGARGVLGEYDGWKDLPPLSCQVGGTRCTSAAQWERQVGPYLGRE